MDDTYYEDECPYCDVKIRTKILERTCYTKRRGEYVAPYLHRGYCCPCCGTLFTTAKLMDENLERAKEALNEWKNNHKEPDDDD